MGVKGLSAWMQKQYPEAYTTLPRHLPGKSYDHLLVDLPGFLHIVLRKARTPAQMAKEVFRTIRQLTRTCKPSKSVVLAMDGPAPLAKITEQRARRLSKNRRIRRAGPENPAATSSLAITPGTLALLNLEKALVYHMGSNFPINPEAGGRFQGIELSGACVPGEGEVKILDRLLHPWASVGPDDKHAILAGDSDLVLMGLMASQPRLHILSTPQSSSKMLELSFDRLDETWRRQHPFVRSPVQGRPGTEVARTDLALLVVMAAGNDYVPGLTGMKMGSLWGQYVALRTTNPDFLTRCLVHRSEDTGSVQLDLDFLTELLARTGRRCREEPGKDLVVQAPSYAKPPGSSADYLQALHWVMNMYAKGRCEDYRLQYSFQAPTAVQLQLHLKALLAGLPAPAAAAQRWAPSALAPGGPPLLPSVVAMLLLPKLAGQQYVPSALRSLMEPGSPLAPYYSVCQECDRMVDELAAASRTLMLLKKDKAPRGTSARGRRRRRKAAKQALLDTAAKPSAGSGEVAKGSPANAAAEGAPAAAVPDAAHAAAYSKAASALAAATRAREAHLTAQHPYQPIPVADIEAAVRNVPASSYEEAERALVAWQHPLLLWPALAGRASAVHAVDARSLPEQEDTREAYLVQPQDPFQQLGPAGAAAGPGRPKEGQLYMLPLRSAPIPSLPDSCLPAFNAGMYGKVLHAPKAVGVKRAVQQQSARASQGMNVLQRLGTLLHRSAVISVLRRGLI